MRVVFIALGMVLLSAFAASPKDRKSKKVPEIQVLESKVQRNSTGLTLDGRVRVTSEKPLKGLVVVFDFLSPEGGVVSSEKTQAAEDVIKPGQEASYQAQTDSPARAVSYSIRAFDNNDRELRVGNSGPFVIE